MSLPIIIVEGADCSGKSTLASQLCAAFPELQYVHFSNLKNVRRSLARMYVEAAMPAIIGHQPVLMDRCWLSELPYGKVFRPKYNLRVDCADIRMIERLMLTCDPMVIYCEPDWQIVRKCFIERQEGEYLESVHQLYKVRTMYRNSMHQTHLDVIQYDWTSTNPMDIVNIVQKRINEVTINNFKESSPLVIGSIDAEVLIIGDEFADHQECDPFYQWPFASFSNQGCSRWLATQLDKHQISERDLSWVNQDRLSKETLKAIIKSNHNIQSIVCLGDKAWNTVNAWAADENLMSIRFEEVPHPQWWKRFNNSQPYSLISLLKDLLRD